MAPHDAEVVPAQSPRRLDVRLGPHGEDAGPRDPGDRRHVHRADRHHDGHQARSGEGDQGDGEEQAREGEDHVHEPHEDRIDTPAVVAGEDPERDADEPRHRHRHQGDLERDAPAEENLAQDVAAVLVGPEEVAP